MNKEYNEKIVVTGIGVVSPIGIGKENFYNALCRNESGIHSYKRFGNEYLLAPVKQWDNYSANRKAYRFIKIALDEAIESAGYTKRDIYSERTGVVCGSICGTQNGFFQAVCKLSDMADLSLSNQFSMKHYTTSSLTEYACRHIKADCIGVTLTNACATSLCVMEEAANLIMRNSCNVVVAIGVDCINEGAVLPLNSLRILETKQIAPFDKERHGTVVGEGAGVLILETKSHAKKRKAKIYGELMGFGVTNDAFDNFTPSGNADGLVNAMSIAIRKAGLTVADIPYINAHGTGTKLNDKVETYAIKQVFGEYADKLFINSTKSFIGHTSGAAGIIETIAGLMAFERKKIHATLNYHCKDPECDLNYVADGPLTADINYFLSNAVGFGGVNASLVVGKGD